MTKQITIEDILKCKKLKTDIGNFYHSKVYDKDIEVSDINKQAIIDIVSDKEDSEYHRYLKLIYTCCPIFKSEELRTEFSHRIKEPYDLIDIVFGNNISEVIDLGNFILKKYGLLDDEVLKNLKK